MMQDNYKILGLTSTATDEEIDGAYEKLKTQYSKDRFLEGEAGNLAAKNLTKLENAYREIKQERLYGFDGEKGQEKFEEIEKLIKDGSYDLAQNKLDDIADRGAEWHYLQSVIFYRKNWINESKKQLEIAIDMDPTNAKYKSSYEKLKARLSQTQGQFRSGNSTSYDNGSQQINNNQMGGNACGAMADCCTTWLCLNCLCNGCR